MLWRQTENNLSGVKGDAGRLHHFHLLSCSSHLFCCVSLNDNALWTLMAYNCWQHGDANAPLCDWRDTRFCFLEHMYFLLHLVQHIFFYDFDSALFLMLIVPLRCIELEHNWIQSLDYCYLHLPNNFISKQYYVFHYLRHEHFSHFLSGFARAEVTNEFL